MPLDRFANYKLNRNTYYIPNDSKIKEPSHPPLVKYSQTEKDENGLPKAIGVTWNCEEPIYLEFRLNGSVIYDEENLNHPYGYKEPISDFLKSTNSITFNNTSKENAKFYSNNKVFQLLIYDTKYNVIGYHEIPITKVDYVNAEFCKFKVFINELCPWVPTRGVYILELDLVDKDTNLKEVLINKETCKLFIE